MVPFLSTWNEPAGRLAGSVNSNGRRSARSCEPERPSDQSVSSALTSGTEDLHVSEWTSARPPMNIGLEDENLLRTLRQPAKLHAGCRHCTHAVATPRSLMSTCSTLSSWAW
jgi:hypothetical protein